MKKVLCTGWAPLTIGLSEKFQIALTPAVPFRPRRILTNAFIEGLAIIQCEGRFTAIDAYMASRRQDALTKGVPYTEVGELRELAGAATDGAGLEFDQPHAQAGTPIIVTGEYYGFAPTPYYNGQWFPLFVSLLGEAE